MATIESQRLRFLYFCIGGMLNTGLSYSVYLLLHFFLGYQTAYFVAYFLGILFSYWFNAEVVFKVSLSWFRFFSYPCIYITQYAASALLLKILVRHLSFNELLAPLLVTSILVPLTYLMCKIFFNRGKNNEGNPVLNGVSHK